MAAQSPQLSIEGLQFCHRQPCDGQTEEGSAEDDRKSNFQQHA